MVKNAIVLACGLKFQHASLAQALAFTAASLNRIASLADRECSPLPIELFTFHDISGVISR